MKEVSLWDPSDHAAMRKMIEGGTMEEMQKLFPASYGGVRVDINNLHYKGKETFSKADQKKAILEGGYLSRPLRAGITLTDEKTGEVLDKREEITLMRVPYYTDRGTFIHNGNDYTGVMQSRMIPGVYTRRQNNGGLESQVNSRVGTGKNFRVGLDPESAQFRLKVGGSNLHLYSILKDAGVSDDELRDSWGEGVLEMNQKKYDARMTKKAFGKMVPKHLQPEYEGREAEAVVDSLNKTQVSREVTDRTLGAYWENSKEAQEISSDEESVSDYYRKWVSPLFRKSSSTWDPREREMVDEEGDEYRSVGIDGVIAASRKLLAVNRGQDELDERNVPSFSKVYTMDKLMRERIRLDEGRKRRTMLRQIANKRDLSPLMPRSFDSYYEDFITKNSLTTPGEETNPMHLLAQNRRVTQMGPGGIGSEEVITPEMQAVMADEFGFYDPLAGPESSRAGVDVRLTEGVKIGSDGRMRRPLRNRRTGAIEMLSPHQLKGKTLKLPD